MEILGEEVLSQSGCFRRVRRWLRGVHPELGTIVRGHTGWETLQETSVVKAMQVFQVAETEVPSASTKKTGESPAP